MSLPPGYAGIGAPKAVFVQSNSQAPPNPAGVPPGLDWYTVQQTDATGHVLAYEMTENFRPAADDRTRISLTQGIMIPNDAQPTSLNGNTCEVIKSATLKRLTGDAYAAATTVKGTTTAEVRVEAEPAC